jgi:tetraacyldisaccharide 4'-kinase
MRQPDFWHRPGGAIPALLWPFSLAYEAASALNEWIAAPWRAPVPVICVGNLTVGGAGKTPTALALAKALQAAGLRVAFLTRGYGGALRGPVAVDPAWHDARQVGDEPLLLAAQAPTWVARDRRDGAQLAIAEGADVIVMDDGLQNPAVMKDLRIVVVDGPYGFGNGRVLPAGPLRETLGRGLARADAFVLIGPDDHGLTAMLAPHAPVLRARLVPDAAARALAGRKVHAFAGIGRPEKFFATLRELGATCVGTQAFPDHHPYSGDDAKRQIDRARQDGAIAVTTAKDLVRLPAEARATVTAVNVDLEFENPVSLAAMLRGVLARPVDRPDGSAHG